jgi:Trk K+ transport system NAD-binding subunit
MFDPDLARRVEKGFGIHTAFSVSALAAPTFAAASMRFNVRTSFYIGDQLLNISEFVVQPNSPIAGWMVEKLEKELGFSVVGIIDADNTYKHPKPDFLLLPETKVLILGSLENLQKMSRLNQS